MDQKGPGRDQIGTRFGQKDQERLGTMQGRGRLCNDHVGSTQGPRTNYRWTTQGPCWDQAAQVGTMQGPYNDQVKTRQGLGSPGPCWDYADKLETKQGPGYDHIGTS